MKRNTAPHRLERSPALRAVILTGGGRYADPWHRFEETAARIAEILSSVGFSVEIATDVDTRAPALSDTDLVVFNIGAPVDEDVPSDAAVRRGLQAYLERGAPLLVFHVSLTSLPGMPEWEGIVGGAWLPGTSMHPPYGCGQITVYPERHGIVATTHDFQLGDERYSYLRVADDVVWLASHVHDATVHPLVWAHHHGRSRVVYDALGHDVASYRSAEHRRIVALAALWLTGQLGE